jgi:transcriptional regulator with XRE-family HTH domain
MSDWILTPEAQLEIAQDRLFIDVVEHIAYAMEQRGISRKQLADLCGVTPGAITQRLGGQTNMTIRTLATTLHHLGYGLELAVVDREDRNQTTALRNYEREWAFEHELSHENVSVIPSHPSVKTWTEAAAREPATEGKPRVRAWG